MNGWLASIPGGVLGFILGWLLARTRRRSDDTWRFTLDLWHSRRADQSTDPADKEQP